MIASRHLTAGLIALTPLLMCAGVAAQTPSKPHLPTTYYVSAKGDDSAPGTDKFPWRNLQRAARSTQPGDTVIVHPGEYGGFVLGWDDPQGGAVDAPVTYQAEPGATIVSRNNKTPDGIDLEPGNGYVVITGFTIKNSDGSIRRAGIRVTGSDHCKIIANTAQGCGTWGIFTSHSSFVQIENNVACDSVTQHGIYVSNSADQVVIRGNTIYGNGQCGIHLNGDSSQGGNGLITNAVIENNIIHDNGKKGGSAINCDGMQNSFIRNNLLYGNHASGISLFCADGAAGSCNNRVLNNTIVMAGDSRWAMNIKNGSTGNAICNNILFNANSDHGSFNISADSLSDLISDYNIVEDRFSADDGDSVISFSSWQKDLQHDQHSKVAALADTFVNPGANDYRLKLGSPAIGAGTSSLMPKEQPKTDLAGVVRPDARGRDVGAYAFGDPNGVVGTK